MNTDILSIIVVVVAILVLLVAETHIAFVTFALCGGYVLAQFAGPDLFDLIGRWVDASSFPLYETVHVSLLLLPALVIGIRFRRTQRGIKRLIEQIVPGVGFALLLAVMLIDIAPNSLATEIKGESYLVSSLDNFSSWLIIFALFSAMFDILIKHANEPGKRRGPGRPPKKH